MKKRILALIMAFAMAASLIPGSGASAASTVSGAKADITVAGSKTGTKINLAIAEGGVQTNNPASAFPGAYAFSASGNEINVTIPRGGSMEFVGKVQAVSGSGVSAEMRSCVVTGSAIDAALDKSNGKVEYSYDIQSGGMLKFSVSADLNTSSIYDGGVVTIKDLRYDGWPTKGDIKVNVKIASADLAPITTNAKNNAVEVSGAVGDSVDITVNGADIINGDGSSASTIELVRVDKSGKVLADTDDGCPTYTEASGKVTFTVNADTVPDTYYVGVLRKSGTRVLGYKDAGQTAVISENIISVEVKKDSAIYIKEVNEIKSNASAEVTKLSNNEYAVYVAPSGSIDIKPIANVGLGTAYTWSTDFTWTDSDNVQKNVPGYLNTSSANKTLVVNAFGTLGFNAPVVRADGSLSLSRKNLKGAAPAGTDMTVTLQLIPTAGGAAVSQVRIYIVATDHINGGATIDENAKEIINISPSTATYGNTLTAKYSKDKADGTVTYRWLRGLYNKTTKQFEGGYEQLVGPVALNSKPANDANKFIIGQSDAILWNFNKLGNYEYRVFCEVTDANGTYKTKAVPVSAKVLDYADTVYGADHESYVEYKSNADYKLKLDEAIYNADLKFGLIEELWWADFSIEVKYQDANAPLNKMDEDWLTEADLKNADDIDKAQSGKYNVYITDIYRGGSSILTNKENAFYGTYSLKDEDDNGAPILKIGTLNVEQTGYPARAALYPRSVGDVTGYVVDSKFEIVDVQDLAGVGVDELNDKQWYRVDESNNWTAIEGATGDTYTAGPADVGYYIGVRAKNWNYKGTIEGSTHAKIEKRVISGNAAVNFNRGKANREGHYTSGGEFTVDVREELKKYGEAIADVEMNLSSHGTIASGYYDAANNQLVFKFRESDTVPSTYAPYKVDCDIEFPGYIVKLVGSVIGTNAAVRKVVIDPIENYVYDGTARTTTAKAYLNEVEQESATIAITYNNSTNAPSNAGDDYVARATWTYAGGSVSDETVYSISKRKLVPTAAFQNTYSVGDNLPVVQKGWFNIVSKDNIEITNDIRKFVCDDGHSKIFGEDPRHAGKGTTKFHVGGTFYMFFDMTGDIEDNYEAPGVIEILVGTGLGNADPTNPGVTPSDTSLPAGAVKEVKNAIYRAYNKNDGDHLITKTYEEYLNVLRAGWRSEGYAFMSVDETDEYATEVYRLYNKVSGEHVYTANKAEYDATVAAGWRGEGVAFYAYAKDTNRGVSVYRLFNPNEKRAGSHHFTINKAEYDKAVAAGWRGENEVFRALEMPAK